MVACLERTLGDDAPLMLLQQKEVSLFPKKDLSICDLYRLIGKLETARGKSLLKIAYMTFVILKSHDFSCDFCYFSDL